MSDDYLGSIYTSGTVSSGGSNTGTIETSGDSDWFGISLTAGTRYTFALTGSTLSDPYLSFYSSAGSLLTYNDDYNGINSQITYTPTASGTYYLGASGYGSNTGTYTLAATGTASDDYAASTATMGTLSSGGSATGNVESVGDSDWFGISLTAGTRYTFTLTGSTLGDPYLSLYSSAGSRLTYNDDYSGRNSQITYTPTASGTYYLGASGYSSNTGTYTLAATGASSDDYAASTATTGTLSSGGSSTGNVESSGDSDWFGISLSAGTRYTFSLTGSTLSDPYLSLYSSAGSLLTYNDDYNGVNSQITYTPTASGTYYLGASGYSSNTGTYTLAATGASSDDYAASTATTGTASAGGSRTGTIETAGDSDWFGISLTAGTRYTVTLSGASSGGLSDPYLSLYDTTGSFLTSNDDYNGVNSQITYTATSSATYYLGASGYGNTTGSYSMNVIGFSADDYADGTGTTGVLTAGGSGSGTIEIAGDRDWFGISLSAGTRYTFTLTGSTLSDPYLSLYSTAGSLLTYNDDYSGRNSQITYTPTASGIYYLGASGYGSSTGTYAIVASGSTTDDYAATSATTGTLSAGGSTAGSIETSGDRDWFAISLTSGTRYTFALNSASSGGLSDPYLSLYTASGSLLTYNDDYNGNNAQIVYTPTSSGTYYLGASDYSVSTGAYLLSSSAGSSDDYADSTTTTGSLVAGGSQSGVIETANDHDWFSIYLTSDTSYTLTLTGSTGGVSDPYLSLYNASGSMLADNDDYSGNNSQITYTPTSSGVYYLDATGDSGTTGAYTIAARGGSTDDYTATSATSGSLAVGGSATGRIESASDRDWFAIALTAGQSYRFTLNGSSSGGLSDPYLTLYNSSGTSLGSNDDGGGNYNSMLDYTATASGTFYLEARHYGSGTGGYTLAASSQGSSDTTAPTVLSFNPSDDASSVAVSSNISLTFSESIQRGSGTIYLKTASGSVVESFDAASSSRISLYGSTLTLDPTANLSSGTAYRVDFASGSVRDLAGNSYAGTSSYNFTTVAATTSGSDDYTANSGTTGRVTVGSSSTGRIETASDRDWFAVTLTAGQTYNMNLNAASSGGLDDPYLELYGSSGTQLASNDDSGSSRNSLITYTPTTSGTYYLEARHYSTGTGNYSLGVNTTTTSSGGSGGGGSGSGSSAFNITIRFSGDASYEHYFTEAAARWSAVIVGDLPDVNSRSGLVDDLVIDASVSAIDGTNGVLAQAGPTGWRTDANGGLPYSGIMEFDSADLSSMVSNGTLGDVITHEMGHVLGLYGEMWQEFGLLSSSSRYQYVGQNALYRYDAMLSGTQSYIPVETDGGQGTAGSHWDEETFTTELMTGYAESSPPMPISLLTIGGLADLGYRVNYSAAESYSL